MDFLSRKQGSRHYWLRSMILVATFVGSVSTFNFVWTFSDVARGFIAVINIIAILLLGKWAFGALRDWEAQCEAHL